MNWHSPVPIQRQRLEQKRKEFWKEAALEGGRPQVWHAIQSALAHPDLHSSILQSANVIKEEDDVYYDWQGWKYVIPKYCISDPDNTLEIMSCELDCALIDDYADDTSVKVRLWNGCLYRVAAGQSVENLKLRLSKVTKLKNMMVLHLGKVLPPEYILQSGLVYQVFPIEK